MNNAKFNQWINKILTTEEEEISCSECFERISEYVDVEASGAPLDTNLLQVSQHILQCQVCYEEYDLLRNLIHNMDAE